MKLNIIYQSNYYFLTIALLSFFKSYAQNNENAIPNLKISVGYTFDIMHQQSINNYGNFMNGFKIGFISSQKIYENLSFNMGLFYSTKGTSDYLNSINHISNWTGGPENTTINLKTALTFNYLEMPIIVRRYFKNKYLVGFGLNLSYLLNAELNQVVLGNYSIEKYPLANESFTASIKYVYGIENYKSTSAFAKGNFAPLINLGVVINNYFNLEYLICYDLLANPKNEYKFNEYNSISNQLSLTIKIKK